MNLAEQAGTAIVVLAAAAAAVSLWRGADRHAGSVRRACWWLALAVVLWGTGVIVQAALPGPVTGAPFPLTPADLPSLLALAAFVAGLVRLPAGRAEPATERLNQQRGWGRAPGAVAAQLADGYVLASALFVIGWIAAFGPAYPASGDGPGMFALELVHPLAGVVALGGVLPFAVAAGRRGVSPFLALLALSAADAMAVGPRVGGGPPAIAAETFQIVGFGLISLTPWIDDRRARPGAPARLPRTGFDAATVVASLAATVAALVVIVWAMAGGPSARPVLAFAGGTAVLALAVRVLSLLRRDSAAARLWRESGRQFRELADRTSDVVLVCDFGGSIRYASPAVSDYGYSPEDLVGRMLADFLHPQDRLAGTRVVLEVIGTAAQQAGRLSCRVRAADGTWRYVESTVSRYRVPGGPDQLLVTARDVSDQVELRRRVAHLTFHDGLTGLPNRAYVEDRARDALSLGHLHSPRQSTRPGVAGVILIDLDSFTGVNDAAGHSAGDLLLAQVARRLRAAVPPQDTVARWGGDEFAVLVEGAASPQEVLDIAERIAGSIAATPFRVAERDVSLAASVGVALADGSPAGYVWRNADVAVSRAKESGGGRVEVYAADLHADALRRLELAGDLHVAIREGQLELDYQPVVEMVTGRIVGAAALAVWRHEGVAVPPAEFLDVAESSGVIVALGDWLLREACAQAAVWRRSGLEISVWVRCTPRQVAVPRFAESVLEAVAASGLPAEALVLEITERALTDHASSVRGTVRGALGELRDTGVRLAIAASGTDYAAVAQLRQLPVDLIKIGSPLVAGLGTDATMATLVKVMVHVVKDLGIEAVAEGIEHPEQLDLLRTMGCAFGQGTLLAGPMTAREVARLARLRSQAAGPAQGGPAQGGPAQGGAAQGGAAQGGPDQGGPDQGGPDQGGPDQGSPGHGSLGHGSPGHGGPGRGSPGHGRAAGYSAVGHDRQVGIVSPAETNMLSS
jgi:diguanylate cyclase (GGDEF)-like protein/PAS domain S-box-containing protein